MSDNPFDPPEYTNERGKRRLVNNLRWAIKSYEIAVDPKTRTSVTHLNEMRKFVDAEACALRKHHPNLADDVELAAILERADEVSGERTDFNSLTGGEVSAPSPPPLPVVSQQSMRDTEGVAASRSATLVRNEAENACPRACQSEQVLRNEQSGRDEEGGDVPGPSDRGDGDAMTASDSVPGPSATQNELSGKLFDAEQRVLELEAVLETEKRRHNQEIADLTRRYEDEIEEMAEENENREKRLRKIIDELSFTRSEAYARQSVPTCHSAVRRNSSQVPRCNAPSTCNGTCAPCTTSVTWTATPGLPISQPFTATSIPSAFSLPLAHNPTATAPSLHSAQISLGQLSTNEQATMSLLAIQTESHAYNMLVQKRPRYKFTGENHKIDFESYLHQCEALMKIPGATDAMKLAELPFWFSGTAGLVIDRFIGEPDATKALSDAFRALKREFGRKRLTAKQMLSEQLQGEKIPEKEYSQMKTFILNLEKIFKIAQETHREGSFDLPECINEIIRTKVPHLAQKWAKQIADAEITNYDDDDIIPVVSFAQFLTFAKKQNSISQTMGEILKNPDTNKVVSRPGLRVAANQVSNGREGAKVPSLASGPTVPATASARLGSIEVCTVCNAASHGITDCRKFAALSNAEKARTIREKQLCTACLGRTSPTHRAINCATRVGCGTCGGRHHTLLHGISYRELRGNVGAVGSSWASHQGNRNNGNPL